MQLRCIVAATDGSLAGRRAVSMAATLAARNQARLQVLTVVSASDISLVHGTDPPTRVAGPGGDPAPSNVAVLVGLPAVEIVRFAEAQSADLVVLGRSRRLSAARRLIGDTGAAVARRSSIPCLFVPPVDGQITRVLAALDGTERGYLVMRVAGGFARAAGARLRGVIVEPPDFGEGAALAQSVPNARSLRLGQTIDRVGIEEPDLFNPWQRGQETDQPLLSVRRGDVVDEVMKELEDCGADLLAVGHRRGGPAGILEGQSVGRRLLVQAPTAILTVPL
jgi:nucleotide-binding universal stress UspA family protein